MSILWLGYKKIVTPVLLVDSVLSISMKQAAMLERPMSQRTEDSLQLTASRKRGPQSNNLREAESYQQSREWTWKQILSQLNLDGVLKETVGQYCDCSLWETLK